MCRDSETATQEPRKQTSLLIAPCGHSVECGRSCFGLLYRTVRLLKRESVLTCQLNWLFNLIAQ